MSTFSRYLRHAVSAVMFVAITALIVNAVKQGKIGVTQACVAYIVTGACWLVGWLLRRIILKNRSLVLFPDRTITDLPPDKDGKTLIVEYPGLGIKRRRIIADFEDKTIRFENCHTPRRFVATASREFTCPLTDILDAYEQTIESTAQLTIVTAHGKALVPESATDYQDLRQLVARVSELTPPGPITENPATVYVCGASAMGGIVIGWMITPARASDAALTGCVVGGAVVGPLLAMLLLRVLGSAARSPLLLPALGGVIGGIFGLSLFLLNWNPRNWALQPLASAIGKPMLVGLVLGYVFQRTTRSGSTMLGKPTVPREKLQQTELDRSHD
jgi:hypothetical protein